MAISAPRARLDPDGTARLFVVGSLACAGLAALTVHDRALGFGAALLVAVGALAIGAHRRVGLTVMWPLAIVALVQPWNGLRVLPFVAVGDIALVVLVMIAMTLVSRARAVEPLILTLIGMLLVTAGGTLGMAIAEDPSGIAGMAKFVLGAPVMVLLLMVIGPTYREGVLLLSAYSLGAAVSTIVAMVEPVDPTFGRSDGWGIHAGHLALSGILGFFIMLGWTFHLRHLALRVGAAAIGLLCLYGVVLSGTRSAVLGVLAGVAFVAVTARWRGMLVLGGFAAAGLLFLNLVVPFLPYRNNIERAFGRGELAGGTQMTNTLHADAFRDAVALIGEHPWTGIGFAQGQVAHNLVLQVASMGGLLALIGLILTWIPVAFFSGRHIAQGWSRVQAIRICSMGGVLAYFVFAQFQPLIWDRHLWFVVTLTLLLQVTSMKSSQPDPQQPADQSLGVADEPVLRPS